jgi:hypothetical protein
MSAGLDRYHVLADASGPPGLFGPLDAYAEVWLCHLGPSAWLLWRVLALRLEAHAPHLTLTAGTSRHPQPAGDVGAPATGVYVTVEELSAVLGLGPPDGSQARIWRAVRRLGRSPLLALDGDVWFVQTRLRLLPDSEVARLPLSVRAVHDRARAAALAC